jgi:hypothetical protein
MIAIIAARSGDLISNNEAERRAARARADLVQLEPRRLSRSAEGPSWWGTVLAAYRLGRRD